MIISLLLAHPGLDLTIRDRAGLTPFAAAMTTKNNKAAQAILNREPNAAEQVEFRCTLSLSSDPFRMVNLLNISVETNKNHFTKNHNFYNKLV